MAALRGTVPFFSTTSEPSAPTLEQQEQADSGLYARFQPQLDADGSLVDNVHFVDSSAAAAATDTTPDAPARDDELVTASIGSTTEVPQDAPTSTRSTTTAPSQPTATTSTPQTQAPSAERTPTTSTPPPTEPSRQQRVETIADGLPFNWRAAGVTLKAECAPNRSHCRWGLYTVATNTVWVGTDAFATNARLFYVVAHEMAHAWQFTNNPHARMNDLADWGHTGVDGLEAAADCLATAWGATANHYWSCPRDAQQHMVQLFNAS